MIRRTSAFVLLAVLRLAVPAAAQAPLTLVDAIARARAQNPEVGVAAASEREAAARIRQARASYLPRVDVTEAWQRGNQPVFVFSSLLAQRQFTAADFGLGSLNHPDALDNFRTAVTIEQSLFDGAARAGVALAGVERDLASARRTVVDQDLAVRVTEAYGRAVAAAAQQQSAAAAIDTAVADRELAGNRRDAGLVTDADVLQLDLRLSRAREQQVRARSDELIARAELNHVIGEPLGAVFALESVAAGIPSDLSDLAALEAEALRTRPDVALAGLHEKLADTAQSAARAAFLPQVAAQGGWELNGGDWNDRASSWVMGVVARINLFNGFADKARLAEAREQSVRRGFERTRTETAARLDVHTALARLEAARASEAVGRAAVEQARESRRIIRDRYEAGLTDVASLLRAAEGIVQAETQQTAARVAVLTETAALERALGRR